MPRAAARLGACKIIGEFSSSLLLLLLLSSSSSSFRNLRRRRRRCRLLLVATGVSLARIHSGEVSSVLESVVDDGDDGDGARETVEAHPNMI